MTLHFKKFKKISLHRSYSFKDFKIDFKAVTLASWNIDAKYQRYNECIWCKINKY